MFHIEYIKNGEIIKAYDVDTWVITEEDLTPFSVGEYDDFQIEVSVI